MPSSARKPWFCCAAPPKGNAQSAETFRVVGSCATDSLNLRSSESNSGQRYAPCPLSFLGRLKPFFSFSAEKEKNGFKKTPPVAFGDSPICQPNRNPMKWFRFGKEEGGCGYGVFAAPAETECSRLLLTQRGPLAGGQGLPPLQRKKSTPSGGSDGVPLFIVLLFVSEAVSGANPCRRRSGRR